LLKNNKEIAPKRRRPSIETFDRVGKLQISNRNLLGRVEYMETHAEKKESWSDEIRQHVVDLKKAGKDQQTRADQAEDKLRALQRDATDQPKISEGHRLRAEKAEGDLRELQLIEIWKTDQNPSDDEYGIPKEHSFRVGDIWVLYRRVCELAIRCSCLRKLWDEFILPAVSDKSISCGLVTPKVLKEAERKLKYSR
jgi:hypothetical protein